MVTYHPKLPQLSRILHHHLPTLHISKRMKSVLPNPPLVAYRRPCTLKDLLVRASMKPPQQIYNRSNRCRKPHCKTCVHTKLGNSSASPVTGEKFEARVTVDCKTTNIIYLIECSKCNKQHVGETEDPLHIRMNGHCSDYHCRLSDKPVAEHFNRSGHMFDDLMIIIIEKMCSADSARCK